MQTAAIQAESLEKTLGPVGAVFKEAFLAVAEDLLRVESRIEEKFQSDAELLSSISAYLHAQGGKRIRPVLTLLAHRLFGHPPTEETIDVAAGIELIHMATLLHDDIIDNAPKRRNKPSAFKEFGLTPSLLAGDFLLVRAFGLCAHLDDYVVRGTEEACVALTEGEVLETPLTADAPQTLERYELVVGKKTASLFSLACELGAHLSGAQYDAIALLKAFGFHAGIAFQMVDDILDITADEDLLGKPSGTDLRQRAPSLVNVLWLASGAPEAETFFAIEVPTHDDVRRASEQMQRSTVLADARELALRHANTGIACLSKISHSSLDTDVRQYLLAILEYTLERCR